MRAESAARSFSRRSWPWVNHGWQVPLYVSTRGLTTSPIPVANEILEIEFDFISHRLLARTSRGGEGVLALGPQTVADFYLGTMGVLRELGVIVAINEVPSELPDPIRFSQDRSHAAYDASAVHRFWRALLQADRMLKLFRSGFLGKASPVHFFWAVSTSRSRVSPGDRRRCIPAARPGCPTR
jgi:Family of unknown function (DUF5996)